MREETASVLVVMILSLLTAWFFWLDAKRRQAMLQLHAELQNRLLEKFSSPQDVAQFLQTEGGRRFLQGLTTTARNGARRILTAMQIGVVLSAIGIASIGLGAAYGRQEENPGVIIGSLILALGAGFLVSAFISYRLSRAWGMLNVEPPRGEAG